MGTRRDLVPGFWLVFWRELGWLRRRPFLLALTTLVPLVLSALLTAVFSTGLATRLPIGVLDLDSSELSRSVIRLVDATPDTAVAVRVAELAEGRNMILSGRILGLLMLPAALLPSLLQIVVVTASAYSAGLDVQTPHRLKILRRLGGGLWPALAGKMLPYTLLFLMVLGLPDAVLFGVYGLPLRGQGWLLLRILQQALLIGCGSLG